MIGYLNGCVRARNFSVAAQINIIEEPSLATGLWFGYLFFF
jgi:hypothetical protein